MNKFDYINFDKLEYKFFDHETNKAKLISIKPAFHTLIRCFINQLNMNIK